MNWVEIQLRVAVEGPEDANAVLAGVGDAVGAGGTGSHRSWFMTSEFVRGEMADLLESLLSTTRARSRKKPSPAVPSRARRRP